MDRDNKYYNLIEQLVRNHRKFAGYEEILENIIDDVYTHSESILNTIRDEAVISAYLQKVVTTSLITVPKRLNFKNELKERKSVNVNDIISTTRETHNIENEFKHTDVVENSSVQTERTEPVQKTNKEFVDKMINTIEPASVIETIEPSKDDIEQDDTLSETAGLDELDTLLVEELPSGDNSLDNETSSSIEEIEEEEEEEEFNIDFSGIVADNNSEVDFKEETLDLEQNEEALEPTEDFSEIVADNDSEIDFEEETLNLEQNEEALEPTEDFSEIVTDNDSEVDFEEETLNLEQNEEVLEPTEDFSDIVADNSIEVDFGEETLNLEQNKEVLEPTEDFSEIVADNNSEIDFEEETLNLEQNEEDLESTDIIENDLNDFYLSDDETDSELSFANSDAEELNSIDIGLDGNDNLSIDNSLINENTLNSTEKEDKKTDYSIFNFDTFEPEEELDRNAILSNLVQADKKNPDNHVLEIFNLKYKQNLTINTISEQLNISRQEVIKVLKELTDLV